MIRIGLVQASACDSVSANLDTLRRFADAAARSSCQAVCFPECFLTGYDPEKAHVSGICSDAAVLYEISEIAKACAVDILTGFMEKAGDTFYITHGLFRKDGTRAYYRKTHLGQKEKRFFTPGDALEVFSLTDGAKLGIALCVETHYPEIAQTLALKGAEVIFAPHAVPRISGDRQTVWGKYIPARSYDNRIYMACCNLWDTDCFGGGCLVTDPRGEVVASCFEEQPVLLTWELDRSLAASFRNRESRPSRGFYPASRRKELYG